MIGGIYAGFNYLPSEHFLFGVEADMNYAGLDDENNLEFSGSKADNYLFGWNTGLQGSLRARAGFIAGNALLYATGGLALGNNTFEVFEEGSDSNSEDIDEMMVGWTAGGGVEYAFTAHWSARIEYRYTDFGDVTITPDISDYDGEYDDEIEVTQQSLMVGLGYAF